MTEGGKRKRLGKSYTFLFTLLAVGLLSLVNLFFPLLFLQKGVSLPPLEEGQLRIHFLDVGKGDCTLLELPDGKTLMIDAGNGTAASRRTVRLALSSIGITALDYFILTSENDRCCGGTQEVLAEISVAEAYLPTESTLYASSAYKNAVIAAYGRVGKVGYGRRGLSLGGADYRLLCLTTAGNRDTAQYASCAYRLEYAGVGILFGAEMTESEELSLQSEYELDRSLFGTAVDLTNTPIVKLPSGGRTGASEKWLRFLQLRTAVVSCGDGESLSLNTAVNVSVASPSAELFCTDECGNIRITISKDGTYDVRYANE